MKDPNAFKTSSFHREGRDTRPNAVKTPRTPETRARETFLRGLVETGKADWKAAPKEIKTRYKGIYYVLFSIPILLIPGYELYRRVSGTSTKKVQEGEYLGSEGGIRKFSEEEKWEVERNSLMYKIFGRDFFLDGFTSKSMDDESKK